MAWYTLPCYRAFAFRRARQARTPVTGEGTQGSALVASLSCTCRPRSLGALAINWLPSTCASRARYFKRLTFKIGIREYESRLSNYLGVECHFYFLTSATRVVHTRPTFYIKCKIGQRSEASGAAEVFLHHAKQHARRHKKYVRTKIYTD